MRNYKLKTYIRHNCNYLELQHVAPVNSFCGKVADTKTMTYDNVKGVMQKLASLKTWDDIADVFVTCYGVTKKQFYNGKILDFFRAKNFIIEEFKKIAEVERKLLSSPESVNALLWTEAGGARLNAYKALPPLNQLAKIYGFYPFDLKHKPYEEILILLSLEKTTAEVQSKFDNLRSAIKK
jgi:hypothetical protein